MKPTLVVLAAGMGSRYGGLKQLDGVGPSGETIMDYSIYDAIRAGYKKVVFVIRAATKKQFVQNLGSRYSGNIEVAYAFQELDNLPPGFVLGSGRKKPWGTGHAVLCAQEEIDGPFVVINADDFYGACSYEMLSQFLSKGENGGDKRCCMCGFLLKNTLSDAGTISRGLCNIHDGKLVSINELKKIEKYKTGARNVENGSECELNGNEVISMNMWGFTPEIFVSLERLFVEFLKLNNCNPAAEFFLPVAVDALISGDEIVVDVLMTPEHWFGVTYREDRQRVVESIRALVYAGKYPARLF